MQKYWMWLFVATFFCLYIGREEVKGQEGGQVMDSGMDEDPNNVEETLIDFTQFEERIENSGLYAEKDEVRNKDIANLTEEEIDRETLAPAYEIEADDFKYDRWVVQLNSSANTVRNRQSSYTKKINLKPGKEYNGSVTEANREVKGKGNSVLGVRVHFPEHKYNANAMVRPPYELRAYDNEGRLVSNKETGKNMGVVGNVGMIKKMSIDVSGRNYRNGIAVRLKNSFDEVKEYFLGYTYFVNWRRLVWNNPDYIDSIDHRDSFRIPLYPRETPFIKFDSIVIYKPVDQMGGNFVVYFRKIDLWFDYAVPPEALADLDIDDEQGWNIIKQKAMNRKNIHDLKAREKIELRRSEILKAKGNAKASGMDNEGGGGQGGGQGEGGGDVGGGDDNTQ